MEGEDQSRRHLKESMEDSDKSYGATEQEPELRKRSEDDPDSDEPQGIISGKGPYTTTELIQKIGFGKAQLIMISILFLSWFSEASEIMIMPILSTRLYAQWNLSPNYEAALGAFSYAGFAISYPIWGVIGDLVGRRRALLLACLWVLIWATACTFAANMDQLLIFRLLYSLAGGTQNIMFPFYYEFLPPKQRYIGFISAGYGFVFGSMLPTALGALIFTSDDEYLWRLFVGLSAVPFIVFLPLGFFFLQESPRYLVCNGKEDEAEKEIRKIARYNKVELPETLIIVPENEKGSEETKASTKEVIKSFLGDAQIRRATICILFLGIATRYVVYGMAFVNTEIVYLDANSDSNYCSGTTKTSEKYKYRLKTWDYLTMLLTQTPDLFWPLLSLFYFKSNTSLKVVSLINFSIAFFAICWLYLCPDLYIALSLVSVMRVMIMAVTVVMWFNLSGLLPTKVRTSLFGICTFLMYSILPVSPFIVQVLAKHSQHLVTSVTLGFLGLGILAGAFLPSKVYSN